MISSLLSRSDYPSFGDYIYLNQAALGLIGQPSVTAMHAFIDSVARYGNRYMSDSDEAAYLESLRKRAAKVLHCDPSQTAIVAGASEILGQLPLLIRPKSGSTIVAVSSDFPALTRPWLRLTTATDCTMRFVDDDPAKDLTDMLIDAIDQRTSVVAVSSVQYATGTAVNIPRLRQITAEVGARLVVDVSQSAGAMPVDATGWGADAVVASGYKWLGGHGGVALAAMSPLLLEQIPPLPGWMSAPNPFEFEATTLLFADDARRYTQSTISYVSVTGLTVALDQLLSVGEDRIEANARKLAAVLVKGASKSGWQPFRDLDDPAASSHIIALSHPSHNSESTVKTLRHHNVVTSIRGGRIRISLAPYNDESDVRKLIEVLAKL